MSEENVEIVRRIYDAMNQLRSDVLDQLAHEAFQWHPNANDPEQELLQGYDEVVAFLNELWKALPGLETEIEEAIDAGSDVVAMVRHTARVPGSNSQIVRREAHVWSVLDGKAMSVREFATRELALEAAGLQG